MKSTYILVAAVPALIAFVAVLIGKKCRDVHSLSRAGWIGPLRRLLDRDATLANRRDANGETPVHHAAKYGEVKVLRLLIEKGGDVDATCIEGATPLHYAAAFGCLHTVELLVRKGASLSPRTTRDGLTPLRLAAEMKMDGVAEFLREAGAKE